MLKALFLLIVAYFIYRSLRNLVDAAVGPGADREPIDSRRHKRPPGQGPVVARRRENEEAHNKNASDIEDATWTDL